MIRQTLLGAVILGALLFSLLLSSCNREKADSQAWADSVKAEFLHAWQGYKKYAWGYDYLKPLSKKGQNRYAVSFDFTPIDAYDTMLLMGFKSEAQKTKTHIFNTLSFDRNIVVSVSEFNTHLLGGLLSAYEVDKDPRFLQLAHDLGKRLLPAFSAPTGMPYRFVNLKTGACSGNINNPAEIGAFIVEFGTLSRLTGDSVFYRKAKKAVKALYQRRSALGLVGTAINVDTGEWVDKSAHIGTMVHTYYEYLLKGFILFDDPDFGTIWKKSVNAVNSYLADEYHDLLWYGWADMDTGKLQNYWFGTPDAFFPAVLSLDGQMDRAFTLMKSCFKMWQLQKIAPDLIDYRKMRILSPAYPLRPEMVESLYYLYYFTGYKSYRDMGRTVFQALKRYCRTEAGYAGLKDVVRKEKDDRMESYFLASTLKYLYLLFADSPTVNLNRMVFNTQGHPVFKGTF